MRRETAGLENDDKAGEKAVLSRFGASESGI
jgi:hypothetical protein